MTRTILISILILCQLKLIGQTNQHKEIYRKAFDELSEMIKDENIIDFKKAVFITENAYYQNTLSYTQFNGEIEAIASKLTRLVHQRGLQNYKTSGNWATFTYMTDSLPINNFKPYVYDFVDFMGEKDYSKMFVTKLMKTHSGNCHSLPYFYKILCEEIGASAHLALAPNHVYIKHKDEKNQWTNLELTNGGFPRDQWIIQQMAISIEAIKNETYMKPLSQKESIAMCLFDLAQCYKTQFGYDDFVIEIVDTALISFPTCMPLLMTKANCLRDLGMKEKTKQNPDMTWLESSYKEFQETIKQIDNLGYKDMPIELYERWIKTVEDEKKKRNITDN